MASCSSKQHLPSPHPLAALPHHHQPLPRSSRPFVSYGPYQGLRRLAPLHNLGATHLQSQRLQTLSATTTIAKAVGLTSLPEIDITPNIEWDNLGFGLRATDQMFVMKSDSNGEWSTGEMQPFGNLELSPSAGVLNYGQGVFEGLKAYRTEDGRILLFRPDENAKRMLASADRLCMPVPSIDVFVQAVKQTVLANRRWIPPTGKGSLYIRPLLIGSGSVLGLAPAPEYTFLIYVSPVGNYFKEGLSPIHLKVEMLYHRAVPGGTGSAKAIGNYASVLRTQQAAKKEGYSDVLYLDALEKKYLEEVSSCNIFVVKGNKIATPGLRGTILPGVTRKSILELALYCGYEVEERAISVDELQYADEIFCTGTAVVVNPVGSITYQGERISYANRGLGKVSQQLYETLTGIQMGKSEDKLGWTLEV